eukprot:Skav209141  [mRNA]  locus=scaffold3458:107766:108023:- [translate_table: standard]
MLMLFAAMAQNVSNCLATGGREVLMWLDVRICTAAGALSKQEMLLKKSLMSVAIGKSISSVPRARFSLMSGQERHHGGFAALCSM